MPSTDDVVPNPPPTTSPPPDVRRRPARGPILAVVLGLTGLALAVFAWGGPAGTVVSPTVTIRAVARLGKIMTTGPFTAIQTAAIVAAALAAGVAAFQLALAAGAPLGGAVFGGNAPTDDGVLTTPFRALAAIQSLVLLLLGWVLLARASVVGIPLLGGTALVWITWIIVVFLALNTVANLAAPHPIERWVMGSITLALTGIGLAIALHATDLA